MPSSLTSPQLAFLTSQSTAFALALRIVGNQGTVYAFTNIRRNSYLADFSINSIDVPATTYLSAGSLRTSNLEWNLKVAALDTFESYLTLGSWLPALDIATGKLKSAPFTLLMFDWRTNTVIRGLMRGTIGETTYAGSKATLKCRGLKWALQFDVGDVTSGISRARTWDHPALAFFTPGTSTNTPDGKASQLSTTVSSVGTYPNRQITLSATAGFPARRFVGGTVTFASGANQGTYGIQQWDPSAGATMLDDPGTPTPMTAGDACVVTIGPPVTFEDWQACFTSGKYFAGEPAIPGPDGVVRISG